MKIINLITMTLLLLSLGFNSLKYDFVSLENVFAQISDGDNAVADCDVHISTDGTGDLEDCGEGDARGKSVFEFAGESEGILVSELAVGDVFSEEEPEEEPEPDPDTNQEPDPDPEPGPEEEPYKIPSYKYYEGDPEGDVTPIWQPFNGEEYLPENPYFKNDEDFKKVIPYDKSLNSVIACWGDSITEGGGALPEYSYPVYLSQMTGRYVLNKGFTGFTSLEIMGEALSWYDVKEPTAYPSKDNNILIIQIGSNGGWDGDFEAVIYQIKKIILQAETPYFIIVADTDDPDKSIANPNDGLYDEYGGYTGLHETKWDLALMDAFGDHFVNSRLDMLKNGLTINGLKATKEDAAYIKTGNLPTSLRYDWTHFNEFGYKALATSIYNKGIELGYWEAKQPEVIK